MKKSRKLAVPGIKTKRIRPSIKTIAAACHVSLNTVSLALKGSERVKSETAQRIHIEARHQGYRPNLLARAIITGRSRMIGVLIPGHDFSYLPRMLEAIQNEALEANYGLLVLSFGRTKPAPELYRFLDYFLERRVEGMIVLPPTPPLPEEVWEPLRGIPTVWIGLGGSSRFGIDAALRPDDAGRIAAERLVTTGKRLIAYAGPSADYFSQGRLAGVIGSIRKAGINMPLVWDVPDSIEGGAIAADHWLALSKYQRPQGVVGFTDAVAVGFVHHLLRKGYRVPEDVSAIGVDDTPLAAACAVPLSTMRAPAEGIGRQAVEILIRGRAETKLKNVRPAWEWLARDSA